MAIYRANSERRLVLLVLVALGIGLVGGVLVGRATAPGLVDQLATVRAQAAPIASSLEVLRSEYPKLLEGGADPGGATGALAKVRTTFDALAPTLVIIDSGGTATATAALEALEAGVAAKEPETDVTERIDAFAAALSAALGTAEPAS
jgi:hypothetical protein